MAELIAERRQEHNAEMQSYDFRALRNSIPDLDLNGLDAQEWISQSRQQADIDRNIK